tara:strand:- start:90 stop:194 length:105 start_codon:yes stop_codon:yes gene_type:complete
MKTEVVDMLHGSAFIDIRKKVMLIIKEIEEYNGR